jgi:septum formation inhibitor MinC
VLAARIARAGVTGNEDPLCTLTDVAAALVSLTAVVASLAGPELGDDDGPEAFKIYAETIDHLRNAADGVVEMAGWF